MAKKPTGTTVEAQRFKDLLDDWAELNVFLKTASEDDCAALLDFERVGKKRESVLTRIHMRYNKMRRRRELREIQTEGQVKS